MPAQLAGAFMQFASVILWTHWMVPGEYGRFALVLATQDLLYLVLMCFWTQFVLRHLVGAEAQGRGRLAGLESWVLLANAFVQTVVVVAVARSTSEAPLSTWFYATAVLYTLTRSYATHLGDRARAEGRIGAYTLLQTVGPLLGLPLGLALAVTYLPGAEAALTGLAFAQLLSLALILREPRYLPEWSRPDRLTLIAAVRYGLPMAASGLLYWASGSGIRFIVHHEMDTAAVGLFSVGWAIGQRATSVAAMLVTTAAFPLVLRLDAAGQRRKALDQIAASGVLLFLILAPCTAGLIALARPIAQILVAPDYVSMTAVILPIATLAGCVKNLRINFVNQAFLLAHRTQWSLLLDIIETLLFLVLALMGIHQGGLAGATLGTLVAMTICTGLAFEVARRRLGLPIPWAHLCRIGLAVVIMAVLLQVLPPIHNVPELVLASAMGAALYGTALALIYLRTTAALAAARRLPGSGLPVGGSDFNGTPELRVEIESDVAPALQRWSAVEGDLLRSPFQTAVWLRTWYDTLGRQAGVEPLLVTVRRRADDRALMLLPLIRRQEGGLKRIEFADLGVTDYAAPLLSPACPSGPRSAAILLAALRQALPDADLLSLVKMPEQLDGRRNALVGLRGIQPSGLFGNVVVIGNDLDAWRASLDRRQRKGLDRVWRVFTRNEGARFEIVEDPVRATRVMEALEQYQARTIEGKGWTYVLNQPQYRDFYRRLLDEGLGSGEVVLSALWIGNEVVAALLGLWHRDTCAVLRIARGDKRWNACSPGRLLIDRTIDALHPRGLRKLDLTIGDYRFKREFKPQMIPLCEVSLPLSLRGAPVVYSNRARRGARQLIDTILAPGGSLSELEGAADAADGAGPICAGRAQTPAG